MTESKPDTILQGDIESWRFFVRVRFGKVMAEGPAMGPRMELTVLNTGSPMTTIPRRIARDLGLKMRPPPKAAAGMSDVHGTVTIAYVLHSTSGEQEWGGQCDAIVTDDDYPVFGMAQMLNWHFSINGPKRSFELRIPG